MKYPLLIVLFSIFCLATYAQKARDIGLLKQADEEVIFSFRVKSNGKLAVLCREKSNKYLVYRFGKKDKVELRYPSVLNSTSWKLFKYSGYSRGGGKQNEATELHSLTFVNKAVNYKLYDDWNILHGHEVGAAISVNNKTINLVGNPSSKFGSIGLLRDYEDLIPNTYGDDQ